MRQSNLPPHLSRIPSPLRSPGARECSMRKCPPTDDDTLPRPPTHRCKRRRTKPTQPAPHRPQSKWHTRHCWFTTGGLTSRNFRSRSILWLTKMGWTVVLIFWLRSFSCVRRISAEAWSLNGKPTVPSSPFQMRPARRRPCRFNASAPASTRRGAQERVVIHRQAFPHGTLSGPQGSQQEF